MKSNVIRVTACCVAGVMVLSGTPINVNASATAGITSTLQESVIKEQNSSNTVFAGVTGTFSKYLLEASSNTAVAVSALEEKKKDVVTSKYTNMAVAKVNDYVNVRRKPTKNSKSVGKLYDHCVATVISTKNGWCKIKSGKVTGYVKKEYITVGNEKLIKSVGKRVATVTTETLRVRKKASTGAEIIGLVPGGEELTVMKEKNGWVKVSIEEGNGYVSLDYLDCKTIYKHAESAAAEKARLKRERRAREAADRSAEQARSSSGSSSSHRSSSSNEDDYSAPTSSNGQAVVNYASQFVGNPYVYGGTSLTNGTDCSGFVLSVYAAFGISLPHSSSALRSVGYAVSESDMQPGDILCYSGHVAIYAGNNTIVHASNPSDGIKYTSPANYRSIITVRRIF
ncbi:MAG: NlpC/P60 family protein [Lachnospiraceae bacterium]